MKKLAFILGLLGAPLGAHPHVFVETGLKLVADEAGRLVGVDVTWRYDAYYSLLILQDMELDADFDGALTGEEQAKLQGFDLKWDAGFEGDLYALADGAKVKLGRPEPRTTMVLDGQIASRHFRPFERPLQAVTLKAYDPTYYTAYDMTQGIALPEGCDVLVKAADVEAATKMVWGMIGTAPSDVGAEEAFPEVGEAFADEIVVTCAEAS